MPLRQHFDMKTIALLHTSLSWQPITGMLLLAVALVLTGVRSLRAPAMDAGTPPAFSTLLHWHDASHDWLLVADGRTDQLTVYSAIDGRPLHRLKAAHGLNDSAAFIQRDGRLFVLDAAGRLDELKSPQSLLAASPTR
jgi:hypothetical protein